MTVVDEHKWGEISYDDERRLPTRSYKSKQATETNPSAAPGGRTWLRVLSRPSFFFCIFYFYYKAFIFHPFASSFRLVCFRVQTLCTKKRKTDSKIKKTDTKIGK